jgi:excisionase family DNA binding protein
VKSPLLLLCLLVAASVHAGANRTTRRGQRKALPPAFGPDDRFVTITGAAEYLGVDAMTVRNMLKDRRLKAWTLGPRVLRIRLSDIDSALQPYGGTDVAT